ncbi:LANO_0H03378g1_1 [Lachancea nothofagi CBS 11611]|uniref:LANO_0H03378g1_1 n=1 Tax=Lachancea nothofagi CBS 11611 TaxID=1266666 RepID=A0A1G4KL08_9SACH|nr:LANO_0H03378g1_1 [Lachancea nothofagi CBS 11611]
MDKVKNIMRKSGPAEGHGAQASPVLREPIASDSEAATFTDTVESRSFDEVSSHQGTASGISTFSGSRQEGFDNRCPEFKDLRNLPFVSTMLSKGFMAFPTEKSFLEYRRNKRRLDSLNDPHALGFPLLHAVTLSVFKTIINRHSPIMRIQRFTLVDTSQDPDWAVNYKEDDCCKLMASRGPLKVFKLDFCEVFQHIETRTGHVDYRFLYRIDNRPNNNFFNLSMGSHVHRRDCDIKINDLKLRWYGTSGLSSPFGTNKFKLMVLDDVMPSFLDYATDAEYVQAKKKAQPLRPIAQLPVWGSYSDQHASIIPKNRTLRHANVKLRELSECSPGIRDVPWDTLVLASMSMLLHELESKKEKSSPYRTGGLAIGSLAMAL